MKRRVWTLAMSALGMLILILDAKTAISGATEGISLCLRSVIPSLLPFFVLSMLLTSSLWGTKALRPLGKLCGIPAGGESLLIVGLLGGYPVGAQNIAQAHRDGILPQKQAQRMLGFCSNAGPAFLFGIVANQFSEWWMGWLLWGIHILSALAVGAVLPGKAAGEVRLVQQPPITIAAALQRSIRVMAGVCGWVILFRILITFLSRWVLWVLPEWAQVILFGLLELTNGCCSLHLIADSGIRFLAASGILAFGGLCVTMQTVSVTDGLGLGSYLPGKLLQAVISLGMAYFAVTRAIWVPVSLAMAGILCREVKKRSSNPAAYGV